MVKDSQSNPNCAAEVAQDLILKDKVHLVTAFATPEIVNLVADQCELNGTPCVSNDDPLEFVFLLGGTAIRRRALTGRSTSSFPAGRAWRHDGGVVEGAVQQDAWRAVGE